MTSQFDALEKIIEEPHGIVTSAKDIQDVTRYYDLFTQDQVSLLSLVKEKYCSSEEVLRPRLR